MNTVHTVAAALTSWVVALLALAGTYQNEVMFWLGLVLVVSRLVQEIPKAYRSIKGVIHGKDRSL